MRTPAGKECLYFYGNYYRGQHHEECRLLEAANPALAWKPSLCAGCPIPGILLANACREMQLIPELRRSFPFLRQEVHVKTYCRKSQRRDFDAHIGCGECHLLPEVVDGEPSC